MANEKSTHSPQELLSALEQFESLLGSTQQNTTVLCLDYDGTLTPIVENPADAKMSEDMRAQVQSVAQKMPVAIVSGRGQDFIREQVQLPEVYYAGSHGFEISGPHGFEHEQAEAEAALPLLDQAEAELRQQLAGIPGAEVERKKYGIAVHYRRVDPARAAEVQRVAKQVLSSYPRLKAGKGKMVMELKPDIEWDKGRAVLFIADHISDDQDAAILYIGDDITDEDAFRVIDRGAGILVGEHGEASAADYRLENVSEVKAFLQKLTESL